MVPLKMMRQESSRAPPLIFSTAILILYRCSLVHLLNSKCAHAVLFCNVFTYIAMVQVERLKLKSVAREERLEQAPQGVYSRWFRGLRFRGR